MKKAGLGIGEKRKCADWLGPTSGYEYADLVETNVPSGGYEYADLVDGVPTGGYEYAGLVLAVWRLVPAYEYADLVEASMPTALMCSFSVQAS